MGAENAVRIVFDLDGTLVDSVGSLAAAGAELCREMNRPIVSAEDYAGFVGRGVKAQVVDLMNATGGLPADGGDAAFARSRHFPTLTLADSDTLSDSDTFQS